MFDMTMHVLEAFTDCHFLISQLQPMICPMRWNRASAPLTRTTAMETWWVASLSNYSIMLDKRVCGRIIDVVENLEHVVSILSLPTNVS